MKIHKGFVLRLKVNKREEQLLMRQTGACRFIYNYFLGLQKDSYNNLGSFMNANQMSKILTEMKSEKNYNWLYQIDSTALQSSLNNLVQAFKNHFDSKNGKRKGRKVGFPKFKKMKKCRRSMQIKNNKDSIRLVNCGSTWKIRLNKLGIFRVYNWWKRLGRVYNAGRILNATIYQDSDKNWYVALCVECETQVPALSGEGPIRVTGIDLGTKTFVTIPDVESDAYEPLERYRKKLKRLNRKLSHKWEMAKKGPKDANGRVIFSKKMEKLRKRIGKLHFKIKSIRKNFNHHASRWIVNNYDVVVMEDLNIQEMLKDLPRKVRRQIQDVAWYQLLTFIKYKCEWEGKIFLQVSRWFPSSKTCSNCGQQVVLGNLRVWTCPTCGSVHHRDTNAAINLRKAGEMFLSSGRIPETPEFLASF